jgi:bifunctional DNA-binding transcriptional regulator/antitoxin component of YhaV-PrlF toxin-antitoxin module
MACTSTGAVIPEAMLDRLKVGEDDALYAIEAPDGSYRLTPYDPAFAEKMDRADDIMRRCPNTLHALAK